MKISTKIMLLFFAFFMLQNNLEAQISGTKTIGGTSPDYATISAAITALQMNGINGNITFNIRDGVYNEKLSISTISGSSTYSIVFQSESQDTSKVKITYTATSSFTNLLNITNVKNISFKYLSFYFTGNYYPCRIVNMVNGVENIKFQCNYFKCKSSGLYAAYCPQPLSGETACKSIEFSNNTFEGGYSAIELYGGYYGIINSVTVTNNIFNGQINNGIYLSSCEGVSIKSNTLTSIVGTSYDVSAFGIGLMYGKDFEISSNKVYSTFMYGILLKDCSNTSLLKRTITNNFVTTKVNPSGFTGYAMSVENTTYADITYNSLRLIGGYFPSTASYGLNMSGSSNINLVNNIIHNNESFAVSLDTKTGITKWDFNYLFGNSTNFAKYNSTSIATLSAWQTASTLDVSSVTGTIFFVSASDLHVNSSIVNEKGTPWASVLTDIDNETRSATTPDIGADEFTLTNQAPVISNQSFSINENSANGAVVGTVLASDPDAGQTLTYSITAGNASNAFAINSSTGVITVSTSSALNFETTTSFPLTVKVQDNGLGTLSSSATVTVSIGNVNEAPIIDNQTFSINENLANATAVGSVVASDPDAGQSISYSITAGNTPNAFIINYSTGVISVGNAAALDYETTPSFALIVKVEDYNTGGGTLSSSATITINLINVNDAPVINNQTFSVNENSANASAVGTVVASDPDAGQALTYSITAGNTSNAFAINSTTGAITVNTSTALNFETTPSFALTVKVQDNGTGTLSSSATITINLTNVNEAPVISNQTFSINEKSANTTSVGTVVANDPDAGQTLTYSFTVGNTSNAFAINSATGAITVNTSTALDFNTTPSFALTVKVQDSGTGTLSSSATVTVNLNKVTDVGSLSYEKSSFIYPNPSSGTIYINKELLLNNSVGIEVYNLTGKLVLKKEKLADNESINLSKESGLLNVRLFINNKIYVGKIIIQK